MFDKNDHQSSVVFVNCSIAINVSADKIKLYLYVLLLNLLGIILPALRVRSAVDNGYIIV